MWVQVDGVQGYDEDQIALVIPDLSNFVVWVPVILGTPTISYIINVTNERDTCLGDTLGKCPLVAYFLAVWWATATIEDGKPGESDPSDYDESNYHQGGWRPLMLSCPTLCMWRWGQLTHGRGDQCDDSGSMCWGWILTPGHDGTECTYMELCSGSKNIAVVVMK